MPCIGSICSIIIAQRKSTSGKQYFVMKSDREAAAFINVSSLVYISGGTCSDGNKKRHINHAIIFPVGH